MLCRQRRRLPVTATGSVHIETTRTAVVTPADLADPTGATRTLRWRSFCIPAPLQWSKDEGLSSSFELVTVIDVAWADHADRCLPAAVHQAVDDRRADSASSCDGPGIEIRYERRGQLFAAS